MSRGRGLAQLILHLSHVTPSGWAYMGCGAILSIATYYVSKRIIPYFVKTQAKKHYPQFAWIVIPHGYPLSGLVFIAFFAFLGHFCTNIDNDDIIFFTIFSIVLGLFYLLPIVVGLMRQHCYMCNNQAMFISRFTLFGVYRRLSINRETVKCYTIEKNNVKEEFIEFETIDKKKIKIRTSYYLPEGIEMMKHFLNVS
jgi:hypothetical protein